MKDSIVRGRFGEPPDPARWYIRFLIGRKESSRGRRLLRFDYGAYSQGAIGGGKLLESGEQLSGVGLATMPLNHFAGIRPVAKSDQPTLRRPLEHIGHVTLKPLDLARCLAITLNADATGGTIGVELLSDEAYRVRGFSNDDAVPLQGDSLRHSVAWKER